MTKDEALTLEALKYAASLGNGRIVREMNISPFSIGCVQHDCDECVARLAQPEEQQSCDKQEPVTWGVDWGKDGDIPCATIIKRLPDGGMEVVAMEYGPPQRPWVGLTDEEIKAMDAGLTSNSSFYAGALWAEAKLKEKNT